MHFLLIFMPENALHFLVPQERTIFMHIYHAVDRLVGHTPLPEARNYRRMRGIPAAIYAIR